MKTISSQFFSILPRKKNYFRYALQRKSEHAFCVQ